MKEEIEEVAEELRKISSILDDIAKSGEVIELKDYVESLERLYWKWTQVARLMSRGCTVSISLNEKLATTTYVDLQMKVDESTTLSELVEAFKSKAIEYVPELVSDTAYVLMRVADEIRDFIEKHLAKIRYIEDELKRISKTVDRLERVCVSAEQIREICKK